MALRTISAALALLPIVALSATVTSTVTKSVTVTVTATTTTVRSTTVTATSTVYSCTSGFQTCTTSSRSSSINSSSPSSSTSGSTGSSAAVSTPSSSASLSSSPSSHSSSSATGVLTNSLSEAVPTIATSTIPANTAVATTSATLPTATVSPNSTAELNGATVASTILIIARDAGTASVAVRGLNGYGIPYQTLIVPQSGADLPTLNSSTGGNFGGFVIASGVVYDYGSGGWHSALTNDQWNQLYTYQLAFGIRMIQWDLWPDSTTGVQALGSCCNDGVEQLVSFSNTSAFDQAGLKTGAGISTLGMFHYAVQITDPATTWEIAQFASNSQFSSPSTAAVINNFDGREQMVFYIPFAQDWSPASNYLQHAWITWVTRGLYAGFRRVYLNTQIDDMMLSTPMYDNSSDIFRVSPGDMDGIATWVDTINAKLNTGSKYVVEIGYNGNGAIISASNQPGGWEVCNNGPIYISDCQCNVPVEFKKTLGAGVDVWPTTPAKYDWTPECNRYDDLQVWFSNSANRDKFFHLSHTFSHLAQNNATYNDILKEIQFNQAWLSQTGIAAGKFSADSLIPPAITGLHNGDALRAWHDAGLTNCVGDNTRPSLLNKDNDMWPLITTEADNGFSGIQITPRWATRIYYNCYSPACTTKEWIETSSGSGDFYNLLNVEKQETTRHLLGLYHDPYMFHQANLRNTGNIDSITINGSTKKISIFQAWVETVVQEFVRLVKWPVLTLQHTDFSAGFAARMARDQCGYKLSWTISNRKITGATVTANNNQCSSPIPVTFPGPVVSAKGFRTEQVGVDPLTIWVTLSGSPISFTLATPVDL